MVSSVPTKSFSMDINGHPSDLQNSESPWPDPDGGISTERFLAASEIIVQCISAFGKVMYPVKLDMEGNINKLRKVYQQNPKDHQTIEEMILSEMKEGKSTASGALLWLKRALHFVYLLVSGLVEDSKRKLVEDDISGNYLKAYDESLRKYHGYVIQKTFTLCIKSGVLPGRRGVLMALHNQRNGSSSCGSDTTLTLEELTSKLEESIVGYRENLDAVFKLYNRLGLDDAQF